MIKLVCGTQVIPSFSQEFLEKLNRKAMFTETIPLIKNGNLILTDLICLPVFTEIKDGSTKHLSTCEQRQVVSLIGAGILGHHLIAIFGESCSGKLFKLFHSVRFLHLNIKIQLFMNNFFLC
jgi:hypothetical protein